MGSAHTDMIGGMSYEHCERRIGRAIEQLHGVESVAIRLDTGQVSVGGGLDQHAVRAAIVDAGYEVSGVG